MTLPHEFSFVLIWYLTRMILSKKFCQKQEVLKKDKKGQSNVVGVVYRRRFKPSTHYNLSCSFSNYEHQKKRFFNDLLGRGFLMILDRCLNYVSNSTVSINIKTNLMSQDGSRCNNVKLFVVINLIRNCILLGLRVFFIRFSLLHQP